MVLSNMLTNMTFVAHEAPPARKASKWSARPPKRGEPYEIIFIDWQMPGLDGIETSKRIRTCPTSPSPPHLVMVTAYGREEV